MSKAIVILCLIFSMQLSADIKVLAFAGSTREDSVNKKLIAEAAFIARKAGMNVTVIDLKDFTIPFYDGDLEVSQGMPEKAKQLRELMIQSQVIFIASPDYNGSFSAVLKNVLDWASRSQTGGASREAFKGKKFILMSASPGSGGGARGLSQLRAVITNIGGTVMPQQIAVPDAYNAFDQQGHLKSPQLKVALQQLVEASARN